MDNPTRREQVLFSYSRKDKKWLELFQATLKPLIKANQFSIWDDTKIKAGDIWRDEIKQALASAKVAVLLVSTNFLASDFIVENELPPLLEAAQKEGLIIFLVVVGHSLFEETEIGRYQAVNDPSRPLASITAASREKEIIRICREIKAAVTSLPAEILDINISSGTKKNDHIDEQIEGITSGRSRDSLTVDLESPNGLMFEGSQIPLDYTVQEIIDELVSMLELPLWDSDKRIEYSLIGDDVTLNNNQTLLESRVRTGDLIRLVISQGLVNDSGRPHYEITHRNFIERAQLLRVFLCHSSDDKQEVRRLYQRLLSDGFDPWLDEEKLLPGQEWEHEITKAVRHSDVVIVCLSTGSINKNGYVQKEIRYALDVADEQREGTIFLIPLRLEECESPVRLRRWHWVDLFEDKGYERLKQSLNSRASELGLSISTSYKPEPQDSSYVHLPILLAKIPPENSPTISVLIWITKTNQRYQVEVPLDATVESLKEFLLKELKVVRRLENGELILYRINSKALGRLLHDNETIRESGVPEMDIFMLHAEFTAG
jgi:hypothetical protein